MLKANKTKILIAALVVSIVSVFLVYLGIKSSNKKQSQTEKFQQRMELPNYFQGESFSIKNNIKRADFKFPSSLPYLQPKNFSILTEAEAKNIANKMGFASEPLTLNDVDYGNILIWNGDKYSLSITLKAGKVELVPSIPTKTLIENSQGKKLDDDQLRAISEDFLVTKAGQTSQNLKFAGFVYLKMQEGVENFIKTTKSDYQIVQINYSETPTNYPIFTNNPEEPQIYLRFLKDGTLVSFTTNTELSFQTSPSEYPLKNYDQFSQELSNGTIVSLNDNNINLPDLKSGSISNINANSVSLVYLLSGPTDKVIQPVFLIQGTADVLGSGNVNLVIYLPAFEGLSQP